MNSGYLTKIGLRLEMKFKNLKKKKKKWKKKMKKKMKKKKLIKEKQKSKEFQTNGTFLKMSKKKSKNKK